MAIKIKFDNELRAQPPTLVLATRSGHKLGCIPARQIVFHGSLANGYELSCSVSKYDNWEKIELWDKLEDFKLAWSPEWDVWFELDVTTNESDDTVKNITATSLGEAELSQVMLYNIEINTETDIKRDDYKPTVIYDSKDPKASLLDRIMEKTPHYKIRHVDTSIAKLQRTFTFDGKSVRDAILEVCKEVNAQLVIHSGTDSNGKIERAYSIYDLEEHCPNCGFRGEQVDGRCPECGKAEWSFGYGDDTGIFVSTENLADDITYETAKDSVKNCFRLVAGDDLMTAAVAAANPNGTGYLWYISDKTKADMSSALRNRLKQYDDLYKATENSSFSFTGAAIRNYNTLAAKYGRNQIGAVEKFSGVLDAYYDTIDFELYLEHGLLPDVNPPLTSAADEMKKLIASISPVSVRTLSTLSSTTATSYVAQAARTIVDPRYSVTTNDETLNGYTWSGSFTITRYSDEEDTVTSATVSVSLNENYENYVRRQIDRVLNTSEFEDLDIVALFKENGAQFSSSIKQYSLAMLRSFYDACQACLNVLIEHNTANESIWAEIYRDLYVPYYEKLNYLQAEISLREAEIFTIQTAQAEISGVISSTQDKLDFEKFMGKDLWLEFAAYRREDTYQNDNYISDGLDNAALVANAREFLKTAQEEIERSATLQHSISANLKNLLAMEEFQGLTDNFELGNWLRIKVDDSVYILRLIDFEINYDNLDRLDVDFSDVVISPSSANDIKSILDSASSMASSYGAVSKQAKHGDESDRQINNWVSDGLEVTKIKFLSDAVNQDIKWDKNGMLFRKWDDITGAYEPTQLRIINSTIAVTDDNWKTVKTAVGGFDYQDPMTGDVKHGYGINAELLIGKLILGEELGLYNANNSLTFDKNGLTITNGDNSFMVSPDGANLLVVECGDGNKVMWIDENGGLHLRPTEFSLTSGETLQEAIDEAKKARNLQIILTNEYEGIPTDASGKYDGALNVKTGVITYYGSVNITNQCNYSYTPSEGVTGSWNPSAHEYTITQLSTDSGYVDITARYIDNNFTEFSVTKRFNVSKVKAGTSGTNGRGIASATVSYASSTQGVTPPSDGWGGNIPSLSPGQYLWTRTVTTYTDNSPSTTSYSVSLIGEDGQDGHNGNDGRGIKQTVIEYKKSDSGIVVPGDPWQKNIPDVAPGEYLWTRTKFTYTDNSESFSYSVGMMGQTGMQGLQGKDGKDGIDGRTSYLHIKYTAELKDDRSKIIMTEVPSAYIGTLTDYTEADSTNPADYTWSKFMGDDGTPGAPGTSSYFHVKYAPNDHPTASEMSETPMEYIGTYVDSTKADSDNPNMYTWVKLMGTDGIPGTNGENGQTSYLHIKYSDDGGKTFTSNNGETPGMYIGQYVDFTQADKLDVTQYSWALIKGADGKDGIPGAAGADGRTSYFHVKYMTKDNHDKYEANPNDPSIVMTEYAAEFMGTYVDYTEADSTKPSAYTWMKVQGTDGIPGENGENGQTSYLHIKYSDDGGKTFTSNGGEDQGAYIGQYVDFTKADSTKVTDYKWSRIEGIDGKDGTPGVSNYFHVRYSHIANPQTAADMTEVPDDYIGTYVDEVKEDSNNPKKYTWTRFRGLQGEDGKDGIPGQNGADGTTYYLHIKYMTEANYTKFVKNNDDPSVVMTETPSEYIGQLVDTTEADSNIPKLYKWSRIEGIDGKDGADGRTYFVETSVDAVKHGQSGGELTLPESFIVSSYYRDGVSSKKVPYPAYFSVTCSQNGTTFDTVIYESKSKESSKDVSLSMLDIGLTAAIALTTATAIRVIVSDEAEPQGLEDALDIKTLPLLSDGKDGKDGTELSDKDVFDKVSNYGKQQGIFMDGESGDENVYVNANYIRGETLEGVNVNVGGYDNEYGILRIYDEDGEVNAELYDRGIYCYTWGQQGDGRHLTRITGYDVSTWLQEVNELHEPTGYFNSYIRLDTIGLAAIIEAAPQLGINVSSALSNLSPSSSNTPASIALNVNSDTYGSQTTRLVLGSGKIEAEATNGFFVNSIQVSGGKYRAVDTENYGVRLLSAMESPTPMFADIGSATCDENGVAFISIDPVFAETIEDGCVYKVFYTQTGEKNVYRVGEKASDYFTIIGEPGATMDWIMYAPQKNFQNERLEETELPKPTEDKES